MMLDTTISTTPTIGTTSRFTNALAKNSAATRNAITATTSLAVRRAWASVY